MRMSIANCITLCYTIGSCVRAAVVQQEFSACDSPTKPTSYEAIVAKLKPVDLKRLARFKKSIQQETAKSGGALFAIGRSLIEARGDLAHGLFAVWVEYNLSFGQRTAQIYMRISEKLPNDAPQLHMLQLRTLVALTGKKIDDDQRLELVEAIKSGELSTDQAIMDRVQELTTDPDRAQQAIKVKAGRAAAVSRVASLVVTSLPRPQLDALLKELQAAGLDLLAQAIEEEATGPQEDEAVPAAVSKNAFVVRPSAATHIFR